MVDVCCKSCWYLRGIKFSLDTECPTTQKNISIPKGYTDISLLSIILPNDFQKWKQLTSATSERLYQLHQCWCINLNLPHTALMWRGFWQRLFRAVSKTNNKDETVRRRRSQNRDRRITRTKPNQKKKVTRLLLVFAVGPCLLSSSALDPVCPASFVSSLARRTGFYWLHLVTRGDITHRLCWQREVSAWESEWWRSVEVYGPKACFTSSSDKN